ncbi:MAG TPA: GNAT family N-acetyltransferase [Burkholderiales bacterium]|jgi:ribosomal protein S18 acetylase RimI-like enzyme|nr:GNAT family N-acetyltransferase [Burkholderiales bacterium]
MLQTTFGSAAPSDIPWLVGLLALLFTQEPEFSPNAEKQSEALDAILHDRSRGRIFVAREGGKVVGMASLLYTISTAEGGKAALFEDFIVQPEYRGQGIGTRLLEYVIQQARAEGVLRITLLTDLKNDNAQDLYRKLGFVNSSMQAMRLKLQKSSSA